MRSSRYKIRFEDGLNRSKKTLPHITARGRHLAYFEPLKHTLDVETRCIAIYREGPDLEEKFFPAIVAETPGAENRDRYLVFFDDGYPDYLHHKDLRVVVDPPAEVWKDAPHDSEFIENYFQNYPNNPVVHLNVGDEVEAYHNETEAWVKVPVLEIDASLYLMDFGQNYEWIYEGSPRLRPIYDQSQLWACSQFDIVTVKEEPTGDQPNLEDIDKMNFEKDENSSNHHQDKITNIERTIETIYEEVKPDSVERNDETTKDRKIDFKKINNSDIDASDLKQVVGPVHITGSKEPVQGGDLDPAIFAQCKEKMNSVNKALKALDKPDPNMSKDEQVTMTRKCLIKVGTHIDKLLREMKEDEAKEWRSNLWFFVSKFTEFKAKKLYKLYRHAMKKELRGRKDGEDRGDKKEKCKEDNTNDHKTDQIDSISMRNQLFGSDSD